jgi:hypothetical protein
MHETSPGVAEEHELSIRSDNKSELNGANSKTNIDMELKSVKNENIDDDVDAEQRIYDDPCDLMDDVPIFRMPKSRSWFCCPSSDAFCVPASSSAMAATTGQTNNLFYNRYPDYSLVTEAPRTHYHSVCCLVKRRENSIFFSNKFPPTAALNWIYDIIWGLLAMCVMPSLTVFSSIFRYKL